MLKVFHGVGAFQINGCIDDCSVAYDCALVTWLLKSELLNIVSRRRLYSVLPCQVNQIFPVHREMFAPEIFGMDVAQTAEKQNERRKQLLYQLNSSGKYFAFKEQLKVMTSDVKCR